MGYEKEIRKALEDMKDPEYCEFQRKLVPNINGDTIIGIRTPQLRAFAKKASKDERINEFLDDLPHKYYDENLVHMFIITEIKDFDTCISAIEKMLPYIDNWAVCDQGSPKCFRKNHDKLLPIISKWLENTHVYTKRFAIRMFMNEYLDSDFKPEYLDLISQIDGEDYYLRMMVAWYFATALAKQYEATVPYIEERKLGQWIHKKTIQKAVESFRVSPEHKEYLKSFR